VRTQHRRRQSEDRADPRQQKREIDPRALHGPDLNRSTPSTTLDSKLAFGNEIKTASVSRGRL
jgi:hypothetical protein